MNDARCELAHHQIAQQLQLCFYQSNHRSDVRSSAMIFQLEPKVGQIKACLGYKRCNLRGRRQVKIDMGFVLMANNLQKYNKKLMKN